MKRYKIVRDDGKRVIIPAATSEKAREIFHKKIHGTIKSIRLVRKKK